MTRINPQLIRPGAPICFILSVFKFTCRCSLYLLPLKFSGKECSECEIEITKLIAGKLPAA